MGVENQGRTCSLRGESINDDRLSGCLRQRGSEALALVFMSREGRELERQSSSGHVSKNPCQESSKPLALCNV